MTTITLPADVEMLVNAAARRRGVSPEQVAIDALRQLAKDAPDPIAAPAPSLYDSLGDYVGTADGPTEAASEGCGRRFTDVVADRAAREGRRR